MGVLIILKHVLEKTARKQTLGVEVPLTASAAAPAATTTIENNTSKWLVGWFV